MKMRETQQRGPIERLDQQRGAVLVVSLVMLMVMTLVGISAMRSAVEEEKMSANSMNWNKTFQAAESAVNSVMADAEVQLAGAITEGEDSEFSTALTTLYSDGSVTSTASTTFNNEVGTVSGESTSVEGSTIAYSFEVIGTGTMTATGAASRIAQGIIYTLPNAR